MTMDTHNVVIGQAQFRSVSRQLVIAAADRFRHLYMIGKTGTGKSTLFHNMILQDIRSGAGCCFVDPHGEVIDQLLQEIPPERLGDVILFDPSDTTWPMGLNLLEWHHNEEKDFLIAEAIQIFYKIFDPQQSGVIGPQFEHWMRNAALTVMSDPAGGTLLEIPRLFTDPAFERAKRQHVTDKAVRNFWEQQMAKTSQFHRSEMLNYFTSKFGRFVTNSLMRNIIGQRHSSLVLADVINQRKILLVNLSKGKLGDSNAYMLGLILMTKLMVAIMQRAARAVAERPPFYLYVDEFQNVMTDAFISMLAEARKYNLAVHVTNQYIAQLTENIQHAILGNAGTLLAFQMGSQDAAVLLREFEAKPGKNKRQLDEEDFQYLPRHHYYARLVIGGTTYPPIFASSLPPLTATTPVTADDVRALSRLRFASPRSIVESHQELHVNQVAAGV